MSEAGFALDARLAADTVLVGDAALCRVLLMDDARWPWLILVPRRVGLTELHELGGEDRTRLWAESAAVAEAMLAPAPPGKLNVAALGNVVAQLHLHHVLRQPGDPAWPGPVWGFGTRSPHPDAPAVAAAWRQRLATLFA
ncbi:MAG: HIT domain-containing protein [Pseudomonadales bacterium]|nr:HIT domain-containing protein [Pseudomonadales bacterium]